MSPGGSLLGMTTTHELQVLGTAPAEATWRRLFVHYVEMILAMVTGMLTVGALRGIVGLNPALEAQPAAWYLLMADRAGGALGRGLAIYVDRVHHTVARGRRGRLGRLRRRRVRQRPG